MVYLPSNMSFVIASSHRLDLSVKQQWYGSYLRRTKFHRTIQRDKLQNILVWPLEKLSSEGTAKLRKQYWIQKLSQKSKNNQQRKWVAKHDVSRIPNLQEEFQIQEPDQLTSLHLDASDAQSVEFEQVFPTSKMHFKKDGTLDMRHTSSRLLVANLEQDVQLQNPDQITKCSTGNGECSAV